MVVPGDTPTNPLDISVLLDPKVREVPAKRVYFFKSLPNVTSELS
jgi:hypothetical protein